MGIDPLTTAALLGYEYYSNSEKQKQANRAASREGAAAAASQASTNSLVSKIDAAYGIGNQQDYLDKLFNDYQATMRPSNGFLSAVADAAKGTGDRNDILPKLKAQYLNDVPDPAAARGAITDLSHDQSIGAKRDATRTLDTRLAQSLSRGAAQAYVSGNSGGSLDRTAKAGALSDFLRGRVGIQNALDESDANFRSSLDQQRTSLEDKAYSGALHGFDPSSALTDQKNAATNAYGNLTDRALGQLLATGTDIGVNNQVQQAAGNQGFAALLAQQRNGVGGAPMTQSPGTAGSISR